MNKKTQPSWDDRYLLISDRLYRIFKVTFERPGVITLTDGCDGAFEEDLTPNELRCLAKELECIADEFGADGGEAEVQSVADKYKEFTDGLSATNTNCIESGPYRFYGIGGEVDDKEGVE